MLVNYILLLQLVLLLLVHFGVVLRWIPYENIWGGRLNSLKEMYRYELTSIAITVLCIWVVLQKSKLIKPTISAALIDMGLWLIFLLFLTSSVANLISKNRLERYIFAPLSLLMAILSVLSVLGKFGS